MSIFPIMYCPHGQPESMCAICEGAREAVRENDIQREYAEIWKTMAERLQVLREKVRSGKGVVICKDERERAIVLANNVLDRVNADPDDDLAVLARQFLRAIEDVAPQAKSASAGESLEQPTPMPAVATPTIVLRLALAQFCDAFNNRGETTSLHEWNKRMQVADANAREVLAGRLPRT